MTDSEKIYIDFITIIARLQQLYEPKDVLTWLFNPHPLLDDTPPAILILERQTSRVSTIIESLETGAHM